MSCQWSRNSLKCQLRHPGEVAAAGAEGCPAAIGMMMAAVALPGYIPSSQIPCQENLA